MSQKDLFDLRTGATLLVLSILLPSPAPAQERGPVGRTSYDAVENLRPLRALPPTLRPLAPTPGSGAGFRGSRNAPSPAGSFLLSAVLPGAGQYTLDLDRWVPYVAIELWGWLRWAGARSEGESLQESYRDLAWFVARRVSVGARIDGDFEYYESLTDFQASGAFDTEPARPGIQPEMDESTFNGSVWSLARALFFPADTENPGPGTPNYRRALEHYRDRAVDARFAWDWGQNASEQDLFARRIEASDEALRRATILLGVIVGNHFVSAVDALITAKLRELEGPARDVGFRTLFLPEPGRGGWGIRVRVTH